MTDKPAQNVQRQASGDAVVTLVRLKSELRDEVFVQLMKQLTGNPSARSVGLGWELLSTLCKSSQPSDHMHSFFMTFLENAAASSKGVVGRGAQGCLRSLRQYRSLPRIQGHLYKRRPGSYLLRNWNTRYFAVRDMAILWWASKEAAMKPEASAADGGKYAKGVISIAASACSVEKDPNTTTQFSLKPGKDGWGIGRVAREDQFRVFLFDAQGSENTREQWMEAIQAHIDAAAKGAQADIQHLVQSFMAPAGMDPHE
jgi:hypothetical protein